jgi:hypothetical protein
VPTYVAGFRQWQQLGRSVLKGQSGDLIRSPVTARFATTHPSDSGSWRRLGRRERPRPGEQMRVELVGVKPVHVWDPLSRESIPWQLLIRCYRPPPCPSQCIGSQVIRLGPVT